ncbi:hypothetical protein G3V96_22855, partial [Escherichia coli]|nr:hypothetical protein [Escherichia coli]
AYEQGYAEGQSAPQGYSDSLQRDEAVEGIIECTDVELPESVASATRSDEGAFRCSGCGALTCDGGCISDWQGA